MNENKAYQLAQKRVRAKKKFYNHLSVYLVMSAFFFLVNYLSSPGIWWFYWPMLGWGIGVAIQYMKVFGLTAAGLGTPEWEEKQLKKEMNRLGATTTTTSTLAPSKKEKLNLDEHLQLKEIKKEKAGRYNNDDLV